MYVSRLTLMGFIVLLAACDLSMDSGRDSLVVFRFPQYDRCAKPTEFLLSKLEEEDISIAHRVLRPDVVFVEGLITNGLIEVKLAEGDFDRLESWIHWYVEKCGPSSAFTPSVSPVGASYIEDTINALPGAAGAGANYSLLQIENDRVTIFYTPHH